MTDTTVINLTIQDGDVYIGRGSIWGNPFKIDPDGTREECIEKYRDYIIDRLLAEDGLAEELMKLDGKRLSCYCKPEACHGDVLVEIIEFIKRTDNANI